jgi:hypothetical protein
MTEETGAPRARRPRKVTAAISPELHAKFLMAKLTSGKTLNTLMIEAIELIVTLYRPPHENPDRSAPCQSLSSWSPPS